MKKTTLIGMVSLCLVIGSLLGVAASKTKSLTDHQLPQGNAEVASQSTNSEMKKIQYSLMDLEGASNNESVTSTTGLACDSISDKETKKLCWKNYRVYLTHYEERYNQRYSVIRFQNTSTRIILGIVVALVLLGMVFAWIQFNIAMRAMNRQLKSDKSVDNVVPEGQVKFGVSEVAVRSSYLGVIILVVSLAFFYLYLIYVYPIKEIF